MLNKQDLFGRSEIKLKENVITFLILCGMEMRDSEPVRNSVFENKPVGCFCSVMDAIILQQLSDSQLGKKDSVPMM